MKRAALKIFLVKLRYAEGEDTQGYPSPLDLSGSYLSFDDLKKKILLNGSGGLTPPPS